MVATFGVIGAEEEKKTLGSALQAAAAAAGERQLLCPSIHSPIHSFLLPAAAVAVAAVSTAFDERSDQGEEEAR